MSTFDDNRMQGIRRRRSSSSVLVQCFILIGHTLLMAQPTQTESRCNYVTLVKCFINILDEWTWTLYELRDNVVTINNEQCDHLRQLDKCIQDDGPESHECSHSEIVAASNTVSDLLTHRKNSGSFLKSYYLLTYACSTEGQQLLNEHRPCLSRERIGEMTISAGTYLSEKFLEHADDEVCTEVNKKLQEYMEAMGGLCDEEASLIMCRSLTGMFKGIHADKLADCEFSCLRKHESAQRDQQPASGGSSGDYEEGEADEEEPGEVSSPGEQAGMQGAAGRRTALAGDALTLAALLASALVLREL
uniref:Secreted protein n=1 Tax=Globodera rostochiensis TaxID=31243 RepID=A0A914GUE6_GLORO